MLWESSTKNISPQECCLIDVIIIWLKWLNINGVRCVSPKSFSNGIYNENVVLNNIGIISVVDNGSIDNLLGCFEL